MENGQRKRIEAAALEMILEIRRAYVRSVNGRVSMNYWEQFQNRARAAAMTAGSASECINSMLRGLRIASLDNAGSRALLDLIQACDEVEGGHEAFLEYVEREHATLIALARRVVEERKEAKGAQKVKSLSDLEVE